MKIKNCPFCNGLPEVLEEHGVAKYPNRYYSMCCTKCFTRTAWFDKFESLIKWWNDRPVIDERTVDLKKYITDKYFHRKTNSFLFAEAKNI